jgi:hypothetical protein
MEESMTPAKETAVPATQKKPKAKVVKAPKEPKATKEKPQKESLVVFAFRLSAAERDLIHKAAGSGKATRLVKGAALAAATGDMKAFEALITNSKPAK